MRAQTDRRVQIITRVAARQHGVVTTAQLHEAGYSASAVDRLVGKGWLLREFRGVYRLGHRAPSVEARYLAAVLGCGAGAALAGRAAAFHYGLLGSRPPIPEVHAPALRRLRGVIVRRSTREQRVRYRGIPVVTLPHVLVHLAPRLGLDDLAELAHEAEVRHGLKPAAITPLIAGRPGAWKLRAIFEGDHPTTLSRMERVFVGALCAVGLPRPITNHEEGTHYVDCRWPARRLTVELDSYRFHHSRHAWEQDRQRERAARARGDEFRRYTWRDVAEDPGPMLADLAVLLRACRSVPA